MSYSAKQLADLAGVSVRTLHYYEERGLLNPLRRENNYRVFGPDEVDRLQQILLYRELGFALEDIGRILDAPDFDQEAALRAHLIRLEMRRNELEKVSASVERMLATSKGGPMMSDQDRFESIKQMLIEENERTYGAEIRERYGDEVVDASHARVASMSEERWARAQALEAEIKEELCAAAAGGDPASATARHLCDLHREWICMFWPEGTYSIEAHRGLGEGYVSDARFKSYYDEVVEGGAEFLRDALNAYGE
jgi:MerR family transcriptional regulator, thiopeptide resistance regulator